MENRYDKYKDSGIAWIGKIPEHWNTYQLKRCSKFINGYAFNSNHFNKDKGIPVIRIGDILNEQISFDNIVYVQENNELEKFIVHKNDILIAMSGATVGKIGIYSNDDKVYINQRVGIIRTIQYNFIKRMFTTNGFADYVNLSSAGSAQPNISSEEILNFYIPAPSIKEQQSIATYLDQKCGEIDKLITLQEKMITKLQSYKQSVITEAVTKGLDKNVPLKDSGIEWIGEIPEHWEIRTLKTMLSGLQDGTHGTFKNITSNYLLLSAKNITDNGLQFSDIERTISENDYKTIISNGYPQKGDILLCCVGTIGRCCIYNYDKIYAFQRSVSFLRTNKNTSNRFLLYLLRSQICTTQFLMSARTSAQSGIYLSTLSNLIIITPPLSEQQSIANYLDPKCREIDELISIKQQKIEKLKDYKKSLIFECVTGKRKVS